MLITYESCIGVDKEKNELERAVSFLGAGCSSLKDVMVQFKLLLPAP